jgi:hypothetical protein
VDRPAAEVQAQLLGGLSKRDQGELLRLLRQVVEPLL